MRYSIKFSKESEIKFVSHLDLSKTMQRVIKRSGLPIEYSNGFNPHMSISIGQPLSVGMYSSGEYMDMILTEKLDTEYIKERLNENAPRGISFSEVVYVFEKENQKNPPQAMALVEEAEYDIRIKYHNTKSLKEEIENIFNMKQWNIIKKSKSGEKETNIRHLVKKFDYSIFADYLYIKTSISCGSRENLSAQLLAKYICINTSEVDEDAFIDIRRNEMYVYKGNDRLALYNYYKGVEDTF